MGAEIGGIHAAGVDLERIADLWRNNAFAQVFRTLLPTIPWSGWSSGHGITRLLTGLVGERRIEDLDVSLAVVATDLQAGTPFPITAGSLVEAIRASVSVPGLFTPVWIDKRLLIDGGVSNPMPVDIVRQLGADVVIAVDVLVEPSEVKLSGIPARERVLGIAEQWPPSANGRRFHPSVFSVLFQMSTVFQKRLCDQILATHPPDVLIRPDFTADPPTYGHVGCGIEAGESAATAAMPDILRAVGQI